VKAPFLNPLAQVRLIRSGIERVILAGSSLFPMSMHNDQDSPDFRGRQWPSWRAQRAIFSRILPFLTSNLKKIARFLAPVCVSRHRFLISAEKNARTVS
jgi:hypothetical protein